MLCRPTAMATSGAATGSGSSDVLPDNEQNENSNDQESDDESQENATPPRKRKKYTCVFRSHGVQKGTYLILFNAFTYTATYLWIIVL